MDTVRNFPRQDTMSAKAPINASIELQPAPRTPPSKTSTISKLYPKPLFSSPTTSTTSKSTTTAPDLASTDANLYEAQQREEYLIEQYSSVLDTLEMKYVEVSQGLVEKKLGSWEKKVLKGILESLREAMRVNERDLYGVRVELWRDFEKEEEEVKVEKEEGSGVWKDLLEG